MKYSEIKSLGSYKPASGGGSGSYTAGTGIDISSNTISAKIDNSTIKVNENGQLYSEGGSAAFKPFPEEFNTTTEEFLTFEQFIYNIRHYSGAQVGNAYVGEIDDLCLPWLGEGNAECTVVYITNNEAVLTVSSSDILPYYWTYNTASSLNSPADYKWKSSILQATTMPSRAIQDSIVQYVGTTTSDYTHGYFYKCNVIPGTPKTYEWAQTNVQPNEGIQTILKSADTAYTPTDSIGHQIYKIELPLDIDKIFVEENDFFLINESNTGLIGYNFDKCIMMSFNGWGYNIYSNNEFNIIDGDFGKGEIDTVNNKYIITYYEPFSPTRADNINETYVFCFEGGAYTLPDPSINVNKLARLTDGTNQTLIFSNGTKWSFLPHQVLHLTGAEIGSIPLTSLQDIKLWGVNLDVEQTIICTKNGGSYGYLTGNTYCLTYDQWSEQYFFAEGFENRQRLHNAQYIDLSSETTVLDITIGSFTDYKISDLGTYGCHIKLLDGCFLSNISFTTGNTLPTTLDIIPFSGDEQWSQHITHYYLNNKKVNNITFKTNTTYFITISSAYYPDYSINKDIYEFFVMVYDGDANTGIVLQANNNTTINGYQVPQLTAEQITQAYNGLVSGKQVVITDTTGLMHFAVNQADVVSGEPIISFEYFDIMELTYLTDGTIEYRTHNNQITLTQEQYDSLTTYADHTDYRIIE